MKVNYLRNFSVLGDKNEKYYLFAAFLNTLTYVELCQLVDTNFTFDVYKRKLINRMLGQKPPTEALAAYHNLAEEIFTKVDSLDTYHKKEAASITLTEMFPNLDREYQEHIIEYFLKSEYKNNRKRAYYLLKRNWSNKYSQLIINAFANFDDPEILHIIVECLPSKLVTKLLPQLVEKFKEEDLIEYDFELRKLRNLLYSRFIKDLKKELQTLKIEDTISYIDIHRLAGVKIDEKFALRIYKKYPHKFRYLPRWYAQLGMWDVLVKIDKENIDPKIQPRYPEMI